MRFSCNVAVAIEVLRRAEPKKTMGYNVPRQAVIQGDIDYLTINGTYINPEAANRGRNLVLADLLRTNPRELAARERKIISDEQMQQIAEALTNNKAIKTLNLSGNDISETALNYLSEALIKMIL